MELTLQNLTVCQPKFPESLNFLLDKGTHLHLDTIICAALSCTSIYIKDTIQCNTKIATKLGQLKIKHLKTHRHSIFWGKTIPQKWLYEILKAIKLFAMIYAKDNFSKTYKNTVYIY